MTVVASNYARAANDLYQTEPWATEALLRHFPVAGMDVWEPAAGNHLMADVLREAGADRVWTSDVATYDRPHDQTFDFLADPLGPHYFDAIITNPPYGKGNRDAVRFVEHALLRCYPSEENAPGLIALLLTAKFDFGKTRLHLTRDNPRFTAKINLVDRIQWFPGETSGTEDHAWYVWTARRPTEHPALFYEGRAT